jgi:hypothetical protein
VPAHRNDALAREHAAFQALAHAADAAVWLLADGRVPGCNRHAAELLGGGGGTRPGDALAPLSHSPA